MLNLAAEATETSPGPRLCQIVEEIDQRMSLTHCPMGRHDSATTQLRAGARRLRGGALHAARSL